ncbi:MAG: hypothetical protein ACKOD7_00930, partial [Polynucleobacter victoriensis]
MTRLEKIIAVVGTALVVVNGAVFLKQSANDTETLEIKTQIRDIRDDQQQIKRRIERVEKVVLV